MTADGRGDFVSTASSPPLVDSEETGDDRILLHSHSGFSALIKAATAQLGLPSEETEAIAREGISDDGHAEGQSKDPPKSEDKKGKDSESATPILGPESEASRGMSFPEILMTLLVDPENNDIITFLPDNKYFALRTDKFSDERMMSYFSISSIEEFLKRIHDWGFSRITQNECGIEIFKHPSFIKGDWLKCSQISYGESPTNLRLSALPNTARVDCISGDESTLSAIKRRLSPSHCRNDSGAFTGHQKQRLESDAVSDMSVAHAESVDSEENDTRQTDDVRSMALAITTQKLKIRQDEEAQAKASTPLIERAVERATHTIVTEAIESLLRDETHTREIFQRHEKELSISSLPGVIPISKQLFSPEEQNASTGNAKEAKQ